MRRRGRRVSVDGTAAAIWDCNGGYSQVFSVTGTNRISTGGKCLDAESTTCTAANNQKWTRF